jgi:hypothetical protein
VVIDHLADVPEASELLSRLSADGIAISIITYMGAFQGVARSPQPEAAHDKFQAFTESVLILPFSFAVPSAVPICEKPYEARRSG